MEVDTALWPHIHWHELPDRAVQLLDVEVRLGHGCEEIGPKKGPWRSIVMHLWAWAHRFEYFPCTFGELGGNRRRKRDITRNSACKRGTCIVRLNAARLQLFRSHEPTMPDGALGCHLEM